MDNTIPTAPVAKSVGKCNCMSGYGDLSTASTPVAACQACETGANMSNYVSCAFSSSAVQGAPTCSSGFYPAGTLCRNSVATDAVGFYWDSTSTSFKACNAGCLTCNGNSATSCTGCSGFASTWVEPTSSATNYATYLKPTKALINNTCYSECPTGFVANSARNSCVAGSAAGSKAAGIIAVFALIASLFIIF